MPRWPVSTTLMPQPATLTTTMAMTATAAHIAILPMGRRPPSPALLPPRKIGALKAMLFSPLVNHSAAPQARTPIGRQQRDRPQQRHAQPRVPASCALGLRLVRIQVARSRRQRQYDKAEEPDHPDEAQQSEHVPSRG